MRSLVLPYPERWELLSTKSNYKKRCDLACVAVVVIITKYSIEQCKNTID